MPSKPLRHAVIDPHGAALDIDSSYGTGDCGGKECYDATLYHTAAFLSCPSLLPNLSLGTVTGIPPLRSMKGNALLGMKHDDSSLDITDVLPSVLPRVVAAYQKKGIQLVLPRSIASAFSSQLFPADEQTLRLVWVPRASDGLAKADTINSIMAPETQSVKYPPSAALSLVLQR